ncbi:MAG: hypothetical protein DDT37_01688 [Firmicutes bacterium]|nr:hypothetical protein [candidate division NPL-UPA2 bacterium]
MGASYLNERYAAVSCRDSYAFAPAWIQAVDGINKAIFHLQRTQVLAAQEKKSTVRATCRDE